ncbi:MAG: hypothetical protein Q8K18_09275 [Burkholderiales bacterium]|nr:hypothetical protein [Burkholderiales bacterium]
MRRIAASQQRQRLAQRGQVLLIMLVILVMGVGVAFYTFVSPTGSATERDKITAAALAQAKEALIGYAAGISNFTGGYRPGDLPCPDTNDSGFFGSPNCNTQASRIGRLPWKGLGLPDLRDADGERLWYAVSNNFKKDTRTSCILVGQLGYFVGAEAGCLNSDSRGTITIRNSAGTVIYDGSNPDQYTPSGVIAVIFAPGAVLQRQGSVSPQDRSCTNAGGSCTAAGVCNSSPTTNTAKCNPVNYLDILSGVEDNANFTDGSNSDGFINGVIRNASGNVILNDRLIVITYQDLMPLLQRKVAKEVLNCLSAYAASNNGRYPWAADVTDLSYQDTNNTRFGRIPDGISGNLLTRTVTTAPTMTDRWPTAGTECNMIRGTAWNNWKEIVFYGVADAYKPVSGLPVGGPCGGTSCLLVNPPSSLVDKRVVVTVAGKRLSAVSGGQPRTSVANKQNPANYLEGTNVNTPTSYTYEVQPISTTFNDFLLYQ